jgi:hypothetical protein
VRSRLVRQRTAIINQIRGFLIERGITVRQGPVPLRRGAARGRCVRACWRARSPADCDVRGAWKPGGSTATGRAWLRQGAARGRRGRPAQRGCAGAAGPEGTPSEMKALFTIRRAIICPIIRIEHEPAKGGFGQSRRIFGIASMMPLSSATSPTSLVTSSATSSRTSRRKEPNA